MIPPCIRIEKHHFDSIETRRLESQYTSQDDCPIARALKELGYTRIRVKPQSITALYEKTKVTFPIDGYFHHIAKCRDEIIAGRKAFITVHQPKKKNNYQTKEKAI